MTAWPFQCTDTGAPDEWDGVCACGKATMDGVRCKLGATHKTLADHKPVPAPSFPWGEPKKDFPW